MLAFVCFLPKYIRNSDKFCSYFSEEPIPATLLFLPACKANIVLKEYHPWSRIERFKPLFCLTFFPGCSTVPDADADIFDTFRSSMNTIPWFLAIVVVFLCRKSLLIFAMRLCSFVILALVFLELLLPFCCRDNFFCSLANCF